MKEFCKTSLIYIAAITSFISMCINVFGKGQTPEIYFILGILVISIFYFVGTSERKKKK